ncbi:MAG: hypothetical protein RIT28_4030 [Pseudomonadota bacterium]
MGVKDLFARVVSGSAGRVVETPVRDIVQEAFRQAEIPSPQELQAVRAEVSRLTAEVHALRNQLSALTDVVKVQQEQLERAESERAKAPAPTDDRAIALAQANAEAISAVSEAQAVALEAGLNAQRAVHDAAIARLEAQLDELRARPAPVAVAPVSTPVAAAPVEAAPTDGAAADDDDAGRRGRKSLSHLHCKVPGCTEPHRSKGFCGKHYQGWRRGRLDGFVGPEGAVRDGERAWRVDPRYEGEPVEVVGDGAAAQVQVNGEVVPAERVAA